MRVMIASKTVSLVLGLKYFLFPTMTRDDDSGDSSIQQNVETTNGQSPKWDDSGAGSGPRASEMDDLDQNFWQHGSGLRQNKVSEEESMAHLMFFSSGVRLRQRGKATQKPQISCIRQARLEATKQLQSLIEAKEI